MSTSLLTVWNKSHTAVRCTYIYTTWTIGVTTLHDDHDENTNCGVPMLMWRWWTESVRGAEQSMPGRTVWSVVWHGGVLWEQCCSGEPKCMSRGGLLVSVPDLLVSPVWSGIETSLRRWPVQTGSVVNLRRACTARVTVLGLCVCASVFTYSLPTGTKPAHQRYQLL